MTFPAAFLAFKPTAFGSQRFSISPQLWPHESLSDPGPFSTEKNKDVLIQSLQKKGMCSKGVSGEMPQQKAGGRENSHKS